MSDAPQSGDDVDSVVRELRLLDSRLGVRWEPCAVMVTRGGYDAMGKVRSPVWRGLWEITLADKVFSTAEWRDYTRVCFVTVPVDVAPGLQAMAQDGAYAPLGPWVVAFLREADKHNRDAARRLQARLDRMNDAADEAAARAGEDGERELLGRMYHTGTKAGGGISEFHPVGIDLTGATE